MDTLNAKQEEVPAEFERKSMEDLVSDIPAMPVVAMRAMRELGDPEASAKAIANTISLDPAMTARLLRIANSPVFGARRKINTVSDALVLIGFSAMKGLIITVSTRGIYRTTGLMEQLLWEHALGCAIAATTIARSAKVCSPDEAFVGGLLHDVGRTALGNSYRSDYEAIFKQAYNEQKNHAFLLQLESERFGITHTQLGEKVIEKWGLPQELRDAVAFHHAATPEEMASAANLGLACTVNLGNIICQHLAIGMRDPDTSIPLYDSPFAVRLKLGSADLARILEEVLETLEREKATFEM